MSFHKSDLAILKSLYFGHFIDRNVPKNGGHIGFLAFWLLVAIKRPDLWNIIQGKYIQGRSYIHLDTIHVTNLKFGMYLLCMTFHISYVAILKILLFGLFMATKRPKIQYGSHFSAHFCP